MALFYFDADNVDPAIWDNEGVECSSREEIEAHAHQVALRYAERHDGGEAPVSVTVFNGYQAPVMVATVVDGHVTAEWHPFSDD